MLTHFHPRLCRRRRRKQDADTVALRSQLEAYRARCDKLERKVALLTDTIKKAQDEVNRNFEAMKRAFQQNAQQRIQKIQTSYEATITRMQHDLAEKDAEIALVNKIRVEQKEVAKREERLISSAFYEMGMEMARHWQAARADKAPQNSWLNKQRGKQAGV